MLTRSVDHGLKITIRSASSVHVVLMPMFVNLTYLTPEIPFRFHCVVDDLCFKLLRTDVDYRVRIRLALAEDADVFLHELLGFDDVDAEDSLRLKKELIKLN